MLRVRVCASHMGGFLGPKSSKQGPFAADFPETWLGYPEIGEKWSKLCAFLRNSS